MSQPPAYEPRAYDNAAVHRESDPLKYSETTLNYSNLIFNYGNYSLDCSNLYGSPTLNLQTSELQYPVVFQRRLRPHTASPAARIESGSGHRKSTVDCYGTAQDRQSIDPFSMINTLLNNKQVLLQTSFNKSEVVLDGKVLYADHAVSLEPRKFLATPSSVLVHSIVTRSLLTS